MSRSEHAVSPKVPNSLLLSVVQIGVRSMVLFTGLLLALSVTVLLGLRGSSHAALFGLSCAAVVLAVWLSARVEDKLGALFQGVPKASVPQPGQRRLFRVAPAEELPLALRALQHDIRGELTMVRFTLQDLLSRTEEDGVRARAEAALQGLESVSSRINQLTELASSRAESESFDVRSAIDRAIALKQNDLRLCNISLETQISPETPEVRGSPLLILEALLILIENAIDAMRNGPGRRELTVACGPSVRGVYIDLKDTGPGIPEEIARTLFGRAVSTKGGTGLGLLLVKEILEQYGGSISFETIPGEGAAFHLELPTAARRSTCGPAESRGPSEHRQKPRVLLIDDEPNFTAQLLAKLATRGYNVDAALTLEDAWDRIHEQQYDAILLDLVFPGSGHGMASGLDLLERLRSENPQLATRVTLVTGYGDLEVRRTALEAGAKDFISKPFTLDEILQVLPSVY